MDDVDHVVDVHEDKNSKVGQEGVSHVELGFNVCHEVSEADEMVEEEDQENFIDYLNHEHSLADKWIYSDEENEVQDV